MLKRNLAELFLKYLKNNALKTEKLKGRRR